MKELRQSMHVGLIQDCYMLFRSNMMPKYWPVCKGSDQKGDGKGRNSDIFLIYAWKIISEALPA